jgi:prepilin-type processing-associated H-X9-DG protein
MKNFAFTVIEALVVIFITLVIAAILFPVFKRARDNRHPRSNCQRNLKQIALCFKQYTQDWNEAFPPVALNGGARTKLNRAMSYGWADTLQPYVKLTQIYQCGWEEKQAPGPYEPWEAGYVDFYFNRRVAGQLETSFNNSANTVMLGEGNDGTDINDARYTHSSVPSGWVKNTASPLHRHLDGANYAFVDGHVKWLNSLRHPGTEPTTGSNFTFNS